LKGQAEELFDFVTVVCYAVPALKDDIALVSKDSTQTLSRPDYFQYDRSSVEQVSNRIAGYQDNLGKLIVLSSFSYFESYVADAMTEILDFHGGAETFIQRTEAEATRFLKSTPADVKKHKRKLQEPPKTKNAPKYRKHIQALNSAGFKFPSALLGAYGVRALVADINRMKAWQIPSILRNAFHVNLSASEVDLFNKIRDQRNDLAHGTSTKLALAVGMQSNTELRNLAVKIDKHLVEHFFVLESQL
jgi:hypothetical protein